MSRWLYHCLMQPVLTAEASAALDAAYEGDMAALMERAGYAVAVNAAAMGARYGAQVVVLAGPGNNGGDGYIAAGVLKRRGVAVVVRQLDEPRTEITGDAARRARQAGVPILPWTETPHGADLIIDALFGGGFRGALPKSVVPWSEVATPVLSVDVASGVDASTGAVGAGSFRAARTVTFHASKVGHWVGEGSAHTGDLVVADIGLTGGEPAFWIAEESDAPRPGRYRHAHKWSAGAVTVAGGSPGMAGAALLTARGALAAGAGALSVSATPDVIDIYRSAPELLTTVRTGDADGADQLMDESGRFDVIIAGPGLAADHEGFVRRLVANATQPLILDAGAIALVSVDDLAERRGPTLLTPHSGEFERLTGVRASFEAAKELSQKTGATVLLKGNPTFVVGAGGVVAVTTGGPELATIGTGDVLAGMVGAFVGRGLSVPEAAISAAFWHGRAGAALARRGTVTADRLVEEVRHWVW